MRGVLILLLVLASLVSFAEIERVQGYSDGAVFFQFTHDEATNTGDYTDSRREGQNWLGAQLIQLHIGSKMDVWLTNHVRSWYEPIPSLDGNVYDMASQKYGAYEVDGSKSWIGNGQVTAVTFSDGGSHENTESAYFLGEFEGGEDVYLWLTTIPEDGGEAVSTDQWVQDANHDTSLVSRLDNTHDIAGNVRINFGIDSESYGLTAREWVAFGVYEEEDYHGTSGQPLPGVLISALLATGTILSVSSKKRLKRLI